MKRTNTIDHIRHKWQQRFDEEPDSWVTVNGNHIPLDEEKNPIGGQMKAFGNAETISALESELKRTSRFGSGGKRRAEILQKLKELKGEPEKPRETKQTKKSAPETTKPKASQYPVTDAKRKQFEIIQKSNPMMDDYHTGIRSPEDIKTAKEAFGEDEFIYPDFTKEDADNALKSGKITIYSSKPIEEGGFVSPSKRMAQDYSGGGKVYSQTVGVDDVAWIDSSEGQLAKSVESSNASKEDGDRSRNT